MYKLLIVEDDLTIASALQAHFDCWDFEVQCVTDFQKVMEQFTAFAPHLVLLDISLPFCDGYHWCSEIRAGFQGAGDLSLFGSGQSQHCDGDEFGRGRFHCKAV